jgi:very-long-chain enoyl-CoA reductase
MLILSPTGKPIPNLPKETRIYIQGSTADLYERIAAESKFSIHRLRITQGKGTSIPNDKNVTVASTELQDGDTIQVKDLGTITIANPDQSRRHETDRDIL